jgi:hypothetical protein
MIGAQDRHGHSVLDCLVRDQYRSHSVRLAMVNGKFNEMDREQVGTCKYNG